MAQPAQAVGGKAPGKKRSARPAAVWGADAAMEELIFASDAFKMYGLKILPCTKRFAHDWKSCPFAHEGEVGCRRPPANYSAKLCPEQQETGHCPRGDACDMAHSLFESWCHPDRYKTQMCRRGKRCTRRVCWFAHCPEEIRLVASGSEDELEHSDQSSSEQEEQFMPHTHAEPVQAEAPGQQQPQAHAQAQAQGGAAVPQAEAPPQLMPQQEAVSDWLPDIDSLLLAGAGAAAAAARPAPRAHGSAGSSASSSTLPSVGMRSAGSSNSSTLPRLFVPAAGSGAYALPTNMDLCLALGSPVGSALACSEAGSFSASLPLPPSPYVAAQQASSSSSASAYLRELPPGETCIAPAAPWPAVSAPGAGGAAQLPYGGALAVSAAPWVLQYSASLPQQAQLALAAAPLARGQGAGAFGVHSDLQLLALGGAGGVMLEPPQPVMFLS